MNLILTKLLLIEYATVNEDLNNIEKLKSIRDLRNLLLQIDFTAEIVPLIDTKSLNNLFSSLKREELSNEEMTIIEELINK